jgi:hypothetical protein
MQVREEHSTSTGFRVQLVMYARAPGRPKCEYGCRCYQANPAHWTQFDHPAEHERLAGSKRKQPEVPTSDPAPRRASRPAPRRARGDLLFGQPEVPKVFIDLENEPVDCPEVITLIDDMGYPPPVAREAWLASRGPDRWATAVQYCADRRVAERLAARLARSEQERRTQGDAALAAGMALERAGEHAPEGPAPEADAALARRLQEAEQARPLILCTPTPRQHAKKGSTLRRPPPPHRTAPHRTAPRRAAPQRTPPHRTPPQRCHA